MTFGITVGDSLQRYESLAPAFEFAELSIGDGLPLPDNSSPDEVPSTIATSYQQLYVHLPFDTMVATQVDELNTAICEYQQRLLTWAGRAGAKKAVLHGTSQNPHDLDLRPLFVSQLETIREYGEDVGVEVVVENVGHQKKGLQLSVLGDLASQANTNICFDVGHAYMEDGMDGITRFLKSYHSNVSHLHVHDVRSRGDTHLPLGAGEVEYDVVQELLAEFSGSIAIEVFTDDKELLTDTYNRVQTIFSGSRE